MPFVAMLVLAAGTVRTDALELSTNRIAKELAASGLSRFAQAHRTSEIDRHAFYANRDPQRNLAVLRRELGATGGRFTRLAEGRLDRAFPARPDGLGRLNVVLITSESFGAEFSRLHGSERDWTPEFDALARQGLWFRHAYASGTRTVRGLEAISTSIPPIPTVSILRRTGFEHVTTLGEVLRKNGYQTTFMYGGYGYFDNMNAFFAANGYEVIDRTGLAGKPRFENVWGVADEDLFDNVIAHADRLASTRQPFYIHVMTTSNHKPFTFRPGLESIGASSEGGGRESGVRYADYAQGRFLRTAAKRRWFDGTLFVVVADHGARVCGREDIPLRSYQIPLLFYAPRHLLPGRIDTLTSQIDIAPTLLDLLGLPYSAPWFGRDVLHATERSHVAFFSHNHDVALYRDASLVVLGLRGRIDHLAYSMGNDRYLPMPPDPALEDLAVAYFQTAYEMFRSQRRD
jgi:membrane-anchored protein YejM (alkaline phosphatase superfamily)